GKWAVGDMIPSENQIAGTYCVSRNTAQKAIEELVQEGLLVRRQGIGTFVAPPKIEQSLMKFYSFSKAMESKGVSTSVKVISMTREPASQSQAKYLGIKTGEEVYVLKRIRYADKVPIMVDTSRIPIVLAPGLDRVNFEENSLYNILETKYKIYITRAKEIFEPVVIRQEESSYLEVDEGSPAIMLDRIAYTNAELPVEFCRSIIPGDKCRFYTELR
ncbi:MAG TPA: GntR family transcriptional regulator, partial [Candidatus Choladousia intestinigallinarum]|nr:GntR family transcriptional regulator [Candidatus Choladousia intestinigallinarum]